MKKMLSMLLVILLVLTALIPAMAEETEADTLLMQELTEWAARYQARAIAARPLNDPAASLTEDGYEFIYDFATIYADTPVMSEDTVLSAIVLTSAAEDGPRGTSVDDTAAVIFAAFYQENAELRGNHDFAVLYSIDLLPESLQWGQVQRDGQRIETIQYAVHELQTVGGEGYTDAGVIYTMEEGLVGAIRVYGLDARIDAVQVYEVLASLRDVSLNGDYVQVPFSYDGAALEKFCAEDLLFSGLDFVGLTPESAAAALGQPLDDQWMEDVDGHIRTMAFENCEMTFLYDAAKENARIYMLMLTGPGLEGPRAIRLGDSFAQVFNRFRNGEGEYDGLSAEVLYGEPGMGESGLAEYGLDASASLKYSLCLEDGSCITLSMHFSAGTMVMDEAMLYIEYVK